MMFIEFTETTMVESVLAMATMIFAAGGLYFTVQQGRRDINGIGRKVNTAVSRAERRYNRVSLALMYVCTEAQKKEVLQLLQETDAEE